MSALTREEKAKNLRDIISGLNDQEAAVMYDIMADRLVDMAIKPVLNRAQKNTFQRAVIVRGSGGD